MKDVWGIHDFVPDYRKYKSAEEFARAAANPKGVIGGPSGCGFLPDYQPARRAAGAGLGHRL